MRAETHHAEAGALAPAHLWKLINLLREVAIRGSHHQDTMVTKSQGMNKKLLGFFLGGLNYLG